MWQWFNHNLNWSYEISLKGQKALRFHQKYLALCSEDERRSNKSGTTWGWVINDKIFIFGWTILLIETLAFSIYISVIDPHSTLIENTFFLPVLLSLFVVCIARDVRVCVIIVPLNCPVCSSLLKPLVQHRHLQRANDCQSNAVTGAKEKFF